MRDTKRQRMINFYEFMGRLGIDVETADKLRRIEMTLHRWAEAECNGEIQREEIKSYSCTECGKPVGDVDCAEHATATLKAEITQGQPRRYYGPNMDRSYPVADRESGALKRRAAIMRGYPELTYYVQGDPRGCGLYIIRKDAIREGEDIGSAYTRGFGVC